MTIGDRVYVRWDAPARQGQVGIIVAIALGARAVEFDDGVIFMLPTQYLDLV